MSGEPRFKPVTSLQAADFEDEQTASVHEGLLSRAENVSIVGEKIAALEAEKRSLEERNKHLETELATSDEQLVKEVKEKKVLARANFNLKTNADYLRVEVSELKVNATILKNENARDNYELETARELIADQTAELNKLRLLVDTPSESLAREVSSPYSALLAMAECMSGLGERDDESFDPEPSFQTRVHNLVTKCLERSGLSIREVGKRQMEVFGFLNPVFLDAVRLNGRDRGISTDARVTYELKKEGFEAKRRRVGNDNGKPSF